MNNKRLGFVLLAASCLMRAEITKENDNFDIGKVVAKDPEELSRLGRAGVIVSGRTFTGKPIKTYQLGDKFIVQRSDRSFSYGSVIKVEDDNFIVALDRDDYKTKKINFSDLNSYFLELVVHNTWIRQTGSDSAGHPILVATEKISVLSPSSPSNRNLRRTPPPSTPLPEFRDRGVPAGSADQPPSYEEAMRTGK